MVGNKIKSVKRKIDDHSPKSKILPKSLSKRKYQTQENLNFVGIIIWIMEYLLKTITFFSQLQQKFAYVIVKKSCKRTYQN